MDDISVVFVDSSMFKALIDADDEFHNKSVEVWGKLHAKEVSLYTSNFIVDETLTLLRSKTSLKAALLFKDKFLASSVLKIIRVNVSDEKEALVLFEKPWSKLSFTDCTSFAVMNRIGVVYVAAFDKHFRQAGFKLVE